MKKTAAYFLLIFMVACSGTKNLSYEELMEGAPGWVRQTPNQPGYYHGVGMATKSGTPDDYREVARQNALSELASGISVNISSTSVLNQYEFNNKVSEYYRDNIQLTTQQYLEGYERVDNWENPQQYWVYYRLSKETFERIKQDRIQKAIASSKSDFMKARNFSDEGNASEAMRFYVKSTEDIKNFLGEDLKTEIDGQQKDYSTLLFSEMVSAMQNLRIVYPVDKLTYKRGAGAEKETLTLTVKDANNNTVRGIAVDVKFSFLPGRLISEVSDAAGQVRVDIPDFDSPKKEEYISAEINYTRLVKESTDDPMVRRMLEGVQIPEYVLPVEIVSPSFYVETTELNMGSELSSSIVGREFTNMLKRDGFGIVGNESSADYIITAEAGTTQGSEAKGKFTAGLSAAFRLKNSRGQVLWSENLSDITGLGSSYEQAGSDAYKSLQSRIRINIYPRMYKAVF